MLDFDEVFIKKLKQQDPNAFNTFYTKSVDMFFRYIKGNFFLSKEDAEDVVSSFFVKMRDAFRYYDDKQSLNAYVWTIFKNTVKDHLRKMSDIPFTMLTNNDDDDDFGDKIKDDINVESLFEQDFRIDQIEKAMKGMGDTDRDIIYLKFIEEKNTEEISKIMGLSQENTRQKISRAIKTLKTLLGNVNL